MQPTTVIFALGVTLALVVLVMLVWRWRVRRLNGDNPEERYRRDIRALQRGRWTRAAERHSEDIWSSGAAPDSPHSRAKKAGATLATGLVAGGCGGCGGCGCGG
jgi:phosphatidylserine/phosphatidylglycerophosphate/cardiolipin synthase-like enzyme